MKFFRWIKFPNLSACAYLWCACAFFSSAQGTANAQAAPPTASQTMSQTMSQAVYQSGVASWYGDPFHGRKTASGEIFDKNGFTAAHLLLPFGTMVLVRNRLNGLEVRVRITDRGPFVADRIIDLSEAAGIAIGLDKTGTAGVELYIVAESPSVLNPPQKRIQLGSFGASANAKAMGAKAERAGVKIVLETAGTLTRVVAYVPAEDLTATIALLKKAGFTSFQVSDKKP